MSTGRHSAGRGNEPSNSDDLERLLADAFRAQADAAVDEYAASPLPRFAHPGIGPATPFGPVTTTRRGPSRNRARLWAPLAAAAAVIAIVAGAFAITRGGNDRPTPVAGPTSSAAPSSDATAAPSTATAAPASLVRITTLNSDGMTYGVGMPVIVYFSKKITDARAFQADTKTTANGKPLDTAWYFQYSNAGHGPIEAQLRPSTYWPAHSNIRVTFPKAGTSLGQGLESDGKLSALNFQIGASQIATVNNATHKLTLTVDGAVTASYPVSLGAANTRTERGVKVIMEKGRDISMRGPGYYDPHIKDTQRLTFSGEYLHAAPWNIYNIDHGINSSNGCTNLTPTDAATLYSDLRVGDVVDFPNANGPQMQMGQGYGLWNVPWGQYQTGGLVPTR